MNFINDAIELHPGPTAEGLIVVDGDTIEVIELADDSLWIAELMGELKPAA